MRSIPRRILPCASASTFYAATATATTHHSCRFAYRVITHPPLPAAVVVLYNSTKKTDWTLK